MSARIIEYKVLGKSSDLKELVVLVNKAIAEGWEPIGGVSADSMEMSATCFWQAVVKREGNPNSN